MMLGKYVCGADSPWRILLKVEPLGQIIVMELFMLRQDKGQGGEDRAEEMLVFLSDKVGGVHQYRLEE